MDIIYLHGLEVDCVIGVWEWERRITQRQVIDLDMKGEVSRAAASDDLADTLNYKAVSKRVTGFVRGSSFRLIETLAEAIATLLLDEFDLGWCRVRIDKGSAVRGARNVGVIIERSRAD